MNNVGYDVSLDVLGCLFALLGLLLLWIVLFFFHYLFLFFDLFGVVWNNFLFKFDFWFLWLLLNLFLAWNFQDSPFFLNRLMIFFVRFRAEKCFSQEVGIGLKSLVLEFLNTLIQITKELHYLKITMWVFAFYLIIIKNKAEDFHDFGQSQFSGFLCYK